MLIADDYDPSPETVVGRNVRKNYAAVAVVYDLWIFFFLWNWIHKQNSDTGGTWGVLLKRGKKLKAFLSALRVQKKLYVFRGGDTCLCVYNNRKTFFFFSLRYLIETRPNENRVFVTRARLRCCRVRFGLVYRRFETDTAGRLARRMQNQREKWFLGIIE